MKTNVFETGISDHYKMFSTIMKLNFTRESPKIKYYRDYRKFDIDYFILNSLANQIQPLVLSKRTKTVKN